MPCRKIDINYTTAQSEDPDLDVASANCALGRELKKLHEYDMVGQAAHDRLATLQTELEAAQTQYDLFNSVYLGLSAYRPPNSPPPPSSPPSAANAPPAAPQQVSLAERNAQLLEAVELLTVSAAEAAEAIDVCVPSVDNTCGRSSEQAPNPWIAADGSACAGNGTYEALEGTYCGYWASEVCCHLTTPA